MKWKNTTIFGS